MAAADRARDQGPLVRGRPGLPTPQVGDYVWAVCNTREQVGRQRFWSPSDPETHQNYGMSVGLPNHNTGRVVAVGVVTDPSRLQVRQSRQLDDRPGGAPEYYIANEKDVARSIRVLEIRERERTHWGHSTPPREATGPLVRERGRPPEGQGPLIQDGRRQLDGQQRAARDRRRDVDRQR